MDEKNSRDSRDSRDSETRDAAAFRAAFGPGRTSVTATLENAFGISSRVLLRETSDEQDPVVLPRGAAALEDRDGRYEIQGELARGGMGIVLKGRDRDLGRDVAIKVLHPEQARRDGMVQRFVEEAQIGGQLQHPGILPVFELGVSEESRLFFSMKLIKGETLAALLQDRPSPVDQRQRFLGIFEQVCQTMAYAHAKGVVHRDLKPANVMVGSFGEVQIVDWGLGKVLPQGGTADERNAQAVQVDDEVVRTVRSGPDGSHSILGSVMGTPAYMPPEQARGQVESLDERSDVFSLGAILCEILIGEPPYFGTDVLAQAAAGSLGGAVGRLDACEADGDLVDLCKKCLSQARRERPRDAGAVAREVSAYLASLEQRARNMELAAAEAAAEAREERRARRLTLALAAAVAAVFVIAASALFWVREEKLRQRLERTSTVAEALDRASSVLAEARAAPTGRDRQWAEARAAGQQVEILLAAGDVDAKTRHRADTFLIDLEQTDKDRRMVRRTDDLTLLGSTHEDLESWLWMDDQFAAAFRDYGIDVANLTGEEVTERVRASAIAEDLAFALDLWVRTSFYILLQKHPRYDFETLHPRLEMVFEADEDPFRTQLRRFFFSAAPKIETLRAMIEANGLEDLPGRTLALIVSNFARLDADDWRGICRHGFYRLPGDVHVANTCASMFASAGNWQEAARYYTSVLAVYPETGGLWRSLGKALLELGNVEEGVEALRRAAHYQADYAYIHLDLGHALAESGRADEAAQAFQQAVRLQPELAARIPQPD